ncbi:MAG: FAD-binding oxidoreductase [Methylococcales bacterium]|jgi:glycine betaine catabolism B|nr:FAD-binding oxidoreductase [Methylococcales bacterium]
MRPFFTKTRFFSKLSVFQWISQIIRIFDLVVLVVLLGQSPAFAQPEQSDHESHHPVAAPSTTPSSSMPSSNPPISNTPNNPTLDAASPDAALMGSPGPEQNSLQSSPSMPGSTTSGAGMMEGMQKMMKDMMAPSKQDGVEGCCGAGGLRKELYPYLMSLPAWTREGRLDVERLAQERVRESTSILQTSHTSLLKALQTSDIKAAERALQQSRDSLGLIASGVAAHRLLIEGAPPQDVAAQWFKLEMNLAPTSMAGDSDVLHGVTPLHLFAMGLLIAFALAMVVMYFFKMRRAAKLFGRIKSDSGSPPPGAAPPLSGAPSPPSRVTPPDANLASPKVLPPSTVSDPKSPAAEKPQATDSLPKESFTALNAVKDLASPLTANWRGRLRVGSIIRETPNVKTLRLLPVSSASLMPFTFVPGQFLNLSFSIGGARMNRSYSISSSPMRREYVDLTVKREPRGAVSRHIDDLLKVGNEIEVGGPVGRFTFTGAEAQSIVLISGGVGITPMMSIARYLTEQSWPGDIYFIYGCSTPAELIFAKDIAELQAANPKLNVTVTMSRPEGTDWKGSQGRITKELLAQAVPDIASRRIHLCGPQVMMEAVKALLAELKVPPEQVKTESFGTAAPTPATDGTAAKPTTPATGPLVTFSKNNKSAKIHVDQTILELSEELAIGIEFSCRVGTCGICKVKMTSGEVEMAVEDGLDADDKANNIILACQAKPKGPVEVEA